MGNFLQVKDLKITINQETQPVDIVHNVSFSLPKGHVLALIGESGSGKTTIALSLLGYAKPGCHITGGEIWLGQDNLLASDARTLQQWRGTRMAYIAQSAAAAFNPSTRLIDQVIESAKLAGLAPEPELKQKAIDLFRELALPDPETIGQRYPHQVSGGQLQRVMAAMALLAEPELVILDEPTTALDVTTQVEVLQVFRRVVQKRGVTAVYVSHDLAVVAQVADQIVVLNHGEVREYNQTQQILTDAHDPYTRELLQATHPQLERSPFHTIDTVGPKAPLLVIRKLLAGYGKKNQQGLPAARVLDDINLTLYPGQAIGVIGESGSGKSTLAKSIAGLLPPALGSMRFHGEELSGELAYRQQDQYRKIQMVFQNADTALNPMQTVGQLIGRPLKAYFGLRGKKALARIDELLDRVQLPRDLIHQKPRALSGGQKQRVNLARALAAEPEIILCDEVTSALDTVVGAAILALLAELKRDLGLSYIFISHDISSVRSLCDDIMVMYQGRQVQTGRSAAFAHTALHPYSALLTDSVPQLRPDWIDEPRMATHSTLPPIGAPSHDDDLCTFLHRCPQRVNGLCNRTAPSLRQLKAGGVVLCHLKEADLIIPHQTSNGIAAVQTTPIPIHPDTASVQIPAHQMPFDDAL